MNRPGHDPTRRNRNIGTAKSGHGKDNRLTIPRGWSDDRVFYEKLKEPIKIALPICDGLRCLVEPPLRGFKHACTIDDLIEVLRHVPLSDLSGLSLLVLRQPKKKERILSPVWGRLVYWAEIGILAGPAIILEAQTLAKPMKWGKSLRPDNAEELDRLRLDGHRIDSSGREHVIASTFDSIRNTQLYRTLPHEVGHYVDYLESVQRPARELHNSWNDLSDRYHQKPSREKEAFANRYADEFNQRVRSKRVIPFDRILDKTRLRNQGLDPAWFADSDGTS